MEFHYNHPLDSITRNNPYSMLEALIPFVDYPLKLPLALLVKYYEVQMILDTFRSPDKLRSFGLHNSSKDPMDMLGSIMGISPDMLKTFMTIMNEQNLNTNNNSETESYNSGGTSTYDAENNINSSLHNNSNIDNNDTFDSNIEQIFAEYDMLQAAEFTDITGTSNDDIVSDQEYFINNNEL